MAIDDAISHITLGQVALAAVALWGIVQFGGRVWRWVVRAVHFIDKLESIERQVHANGGSSLRDAVDQIGVTQGALAQAQVELAAAQEAQAGETRELRAAFEQHVIESARGPRRADDPPEADHRPTTPHGGTP